MDCCVKGQGGSKGWNTFLTADPFRISWLIRTSKTWWHITISKAGWHNTNFNRTVKRQEQCSSKQDKNCPSFPPTPLLEDTTVPLIDSVKSLGVLLYSTLTMENLISQTSKSCCYQLRRISSVRKYRFTEATEKLVASLILSRLDYCSSLLSGLPASSVHSNRRIQNCAVRLIPRFPGSLEVLIITY